MFEIAFATYLAFVAQETDAIEYKPKTVVDFSEVSVTAQIVRPEAVLIQARDRSKFKPLVRSRANFLPELVESLEQL